LGFACLSGTGGGFLRLGLLFGAGLSLLELVVVLVRFVQRVGLGWVLCEQIVW